MNVPGEIVFAGTAGGYGYVIDAWVPSLGAQFRLAHLSRFFKKSGTFTAGEALGETGGAKVTLVQVVLLVLTYTMRLILPRVVLVMVVLEIQSYYLNYPNIL